MPDDISVDDGEDLTGNEVLDELFTKVREMCAIRTESLYDEMAEQTLRAERVARTNASSVDAIKTFENQIQRRKAQMMLAAKQGNRGLSQKDPAYVSEKEVEANQDLDPEITRLEDALSTAYAAKAYLDTMTKAVGEGRNTMLVNLHRWITAETGVKM